MDRKKIAGLVIAVGVAMVVIALIADAINLGEEGFGWRRGVFLAAGVVVALAGLIYLRLPGAADEPPADTEADRPSEPST
jgi:hypothetical protein